MLQRSSFVRAAVNKPWHTYLYTLYSIAPVHIVGIVGTIVLAMCSVSKVSERVVYGLIVLCGGDSENVNRPATEYAGTDITVVGSIATSDGDSNDIANSADISTTSMDRRASLRRRCKEPSVTTANPVLTSTSVVNPPLTTQHPLSLPLPPVKAYMDAVDPFVLTLLLFSLWPVGFLVGLTLLGSAGSGFQSRFLMPMLPGSAILTTLCVHWVHLTSSTVSYKDRFMSTACRVVVGVFMMYSVMHVFYYGVLYAPLFADLDVSLVNILCSMLQNVYFAPASREEFRATLKFMAHYGMVRETS